MLNFRGARMPMRTKTEGSGSAIACTSSFLSGSSGRRLTDSPGKFLFLRGNAKRFRNFHARPQFNDPRLGLPGFRVGLRIIDGQAELNGVLVDAPVTLDPAHLVTIRLALRA